MHKEIFSILRKIVFVCLEKKRETEIKDLGSENVEFWYPDDLLKWIPKMLNIEFQKEIQKIQERGIKENKQMRNLNINNAIKRLEQ
jgi:hypothetical protein